MELTSNGDGLSSTDFANFNAVVTALCCLTTPRPTRTRPALHAYVVLPGYVREKSASSNARRNEDQALAASTIYFGFGTLL